MILPHRPAWERARDRGGNSGALPLSYGLPPFSHSLLLRGRRKRSPWQWWSRLHHARGFVPRRPAGITPGSSPSHLRVGVRRSGETESPRPRLLCAGGAMLSLPSDWACCAACAATPPSSRAGFPCRSCPVRSPNCRRAACSPPRPDARLPRADGCTSPAARAAMCRRAGAARARGRIGTASSCFGRDPSGCPGSTNEKSRLRCLAVHSCCGAAVLPRNAGRTAERSSGRDSQGRQL